ncbi:hypothetical protein ACWDBD_35410 [Streptomyces sp. NPDC001118]|uniref:hypothetical protein n=1 Tax=unclassified Streptomyces TaxID=2593676 RepID=UPI00332008D9
MYKRKHLIKRTAMAAALVGAAGFAAVAPAQAAPTSQNLQAPHSWWHAAHFEGAVKAVHAGSIDVDVHGSVQTIDTTNAMVIGKLEAGVTVDVTNWGSGTVIVALNNWG